MDPLLLSNGSSDVPAAMVLVHGAGTSEISPFMEAIAEGMSSRGCLVYRFPFPYMRRTQETERRCPPDKPQVLQQCFRAC